MATGSQQLLKQPLHIIKNKQFHDSHCAQTWLLLQDFKSKAVAGSYLSQMAFGPCCSSLPFDIQQDQTFQFHLKERDLLLRVVMYWHPRQIQNQNNWSKQYIHSCSFPDKLNFFWSFVFESFILIIRIRISSTFISPSFNSKPFCDSC